MVDDLPAGADDLFAGIARMTDEAWPAEPVGTGPTAAAAAGRGLLALLVLDGAAAGRGRAGVHPALRRRGPGARWARWPRSCCCPGWSAGPPSSTPGPPAAAPLSAWAVTIGVLGLAGPGGDVLLPVTWPTLLLLFGGLGAGLWRCAARE